MLFFRLCLYQISISSNKRQHFLVVDLWNQNLPCKYKEIKDYIIIKSYEIYLKNKAIRDKLHCQVMYK